MIKGKHPQWWFAQAVWLVLLLVFWHPAATASTDVRVSFDGLPVQFEVPPLIRDDRTFVPVRFVLERVEAKVTWNGDLRQVRIEDGPKVVILTIDSKRVLVNGIAQEIDVAPFILKDRTMVPLRFVSETFGFEVDWDQQSRTVVLTSPAALAAKAKEFQPVIIGGGGPATSGPALVLDTPTSLQVGQQFLVIVRLRNVMDVKATYSHLVYDSTKVQPIVINSGSIVEGMTLAKEIDSAAGVIIYGTAIPGTASFSGSGVLYSIGFKAIAPGQLTFQIKPSLASDPILMNSNGTAVQVSIASTQLQIN